MKSIIDLTKQNFDRIDFTEATIIDFHCQNKLPSRVTFNVWGATLLLESRWKHAERFDSSLSCDEDMYIAGNGIISMENIVGGNIEVYVYDKINNKGITDVAKFEDGSELVLRREWSFVKTELIDEYLWECVIHWPYGFCNLHLFSSGGTVSYQFDTDDMIPTNDYIMNPKLYRFRRGK